MDVGAICGIGEFVAFAACQHTMMKNKQRGLPVSTRAEFKKKCKGRLIVTAVVPEDMSTISATIKDSSGEVCAIVYTELNIK